MNGCWPSSSSSAYQHPPHRQSLKNPSVVIILGIPATASNTIRRVTEQNVLRFQQRLSMRILVFVHKHSKINIVERTYRAHCLPYLLRRLGPTSAKLRGCCRLRHVNHFYHRVIFFHLHFLSNRSSQNAPSPLSSVDAWAQPSPSSETSLVIGTV